MDVITLGVFQMAEQDRVRRAEEWLDWVLFEVRLQTDDAFRDAYRAAVRAVPEVEAVAEATVSCLHCAPRPALAEAYLYADGEVVVSPFRRLGRKALAQRTSEAEFTMSLLADLGVDVPEVPGDWDRTGQYWEDTVSSSEHQLARLRCRHCKAPIPLVLEKLRDPLRAGHRQLLVGRNGEVVPVGGPQAPALGVRP